MSHSWLHSRRKSGRSKPVFIASAVLLLALLALAVSTLADCRMRQIYPFPYRSLIVTHATANGISPHLVAAVIRAESNFWPWAVSPKGALGLMQLTPETARWVAGQAGWAGLDEKLLHDAETNIALGCWYLAHLLRQYEGNLAVALAAWNGGRTNVTGWLNTGVWSGRAADLERIPFAETRGFVSRVLSNLTWYEKLYPEVAH